MRLLGGSGRLFLTGTTGNRESSGSQSVPPPSTVIFNRDDSSGDPQMSTQIEILTALDAELARSEKRERFKVREKNS